MRLRSAALSVIVAFQTPSASLSGPGVVVEESGKPLPGVVLLRYDYVKVPFQGSDCGHVVSVTSGSDGRFHLPSWHNFWALDQKKLVVYQPGKALKTVDPATMRIEMVRHDTSPEERLVYLNHIAATSVCGLDASRDVLHVLEAVMQEEESLARKDEDRRKYLGYIQGRIENERLRITRSKEGR
jgi:hypothetical protein